MRRKPVILTAFTAGVSAGILHLLGYLGGHAWILDNLNAFKTQYLTIMLACSLILAYEKSLKPAATLLAISATIIYPLLPYYTTPTYEKSTGAYRHLLFNVETRNNRHQLTAEYIMQEDPDFLSLLEIDDVWWSELREIRRRYPYKSVVSRPDNFGIAFLSKYPAITEIVDDLSDAAIPTLKSEITLKDRTLTIITTHPLPPVTAERARHRNQQLKNLPRLVEDENTMLTGDLNTPVCSPKYGKLLEETGLRDSALGYGIQDTWPTYLPWIKTPIDHTLVSDNIIVTNRRVGRKLGSDHHPVITDFTLTG